MVRVGGRARLPHTRPRAQPALRGPGVPPPVRAPRHALLAARSLPRGGPAAPRRTGVGRHPRRARPRSLRREQPAGNRLAAVPEVDHERAPRPGGRRPWRRRLPHLGHCRGTGPVRGQVMAASRVPPTRVSSWDLIVGVTGLALCRHVLSGPRNRSRQRIDELRALLAAGDAGWEAVPAGELAPVAGYALWAAAYDAPGNPLIAVEQPIVRALLDRAPRGRALDVACGTGRHAAYLAASGHEVVGVDSSAKMLQVARRRLPGVELRQASIESLPFADGCFDLVVCALALTHLPSLDRATAELARVVRRGGGRLVLSDIHPSIVAVLDGRPASGWPTAAADSSAMTSTCRGPSRS